MRVVVTGASRAEKGRLLIKLMELLTAEGCSFELDDHGRELTKYHPPVEALHGGTVLLSAPREFTGDVFPRPMPPKR